MEIISVAVGSLLILLTVLPLVPRDDWWVRLGDFPRAQIALVGIAVIAGYTRVAEWEQPFDLGFGAALAACVLYQVARMLPYTVLHRKQVQRSRRTESEAGFSLLVANVLMTNQEPTKLREIIRSCDPDLVVAVETDESWQEQLRELEQSHPYTVHHPLPNTYGMLLYSRLPLIGPDVRFLVEDDIPSIHTEVEMLSGERFELHCLHPRPPSPTENDRSTERDAELLLVGKSVAGSGTPVVVAGDMNDVAWSHTTQLFQKVSGLLDPRVGRGFFNTFHAGWPFLRWPLDHVFHSAHFRLVDLRRLPRFGSDHFPIFISLRLEPDAALRQEVPRADPEEQEEAEEKIAEVGADTTAL